MKTINGRTKEEAAALAYKAGFEGEKNRMCCSQETFHAVSSVLGVKNPQVFRSLSAFEGGTAITTEGTCGAVAGAMAAFSFFFGRTYEDWEQKKMVCDSSFMGQDLIKEFKKSFGSIICREVLTHEMGRSFDFSKKEELVCYEEMGGHAKVCPNVVGTAAALTVELLWDKLTGDADYSGIPDFTR